MYLNGVLDLFYKIFGFLQFCDLLGTYWHLRTTDRADLKICGTKIFSPMILGLKSIISSVKTHMMTIPGVFGAFSGDFWPFSPSLSQKWSFFRKTKNSIF